MHSYPPRSKRHLLGALALAGTAFGLLMLHSVSAYAIHFDVSISLDNGPVAGSKLITGAFGDLPFDTQPFDHLTGQALFPGDFGDFEGEFFIGLNSCRPVVGCA